MGRIPYGYKLLNGEGSDLIIDDCQQDIIVVIKYLRDDYKFSFRLIAETLNETKISPPKGKTHSGKWNHKTISRIYNRDDSSIITKGKSKNINKD